MAEASSIFAAVTTNTSSDELILYGIKQTIDSQVTSIPEGVKDDQELSNNVNSSSSLGQVDDLHVELGEESAQNPDTQVTNSTNSSQIEVIDERKEEQNTANLKRTENNEGKKEKRPRNRGKGLKKGAVLSDDFERQSVCDCDKRGDKARVKYSREEIESFRFVGVEEQKKKWSEVYCKLGSDVAKEYDCLKGFGHGDDDDENYVNFDPRPQLANKKGNKTENNVSEKQDTNQVDQVSSVNGSDLDDDYYEDEDSDSEHVSIQRPAFFVTGEPDFDSGPPLDGLEYLRRVRWETEHIPKVKVVKLERSILNKEQTVYMPKIPNIAACPEHLMPSKEWENIFLADFSTLRLALSQTETSAPTFSTKIESIPLAQTIIESVIQENLDSDSTDNTTTNEIQENLEACNLPSLQIILEMEPVARITMLRKRITLMETMSSLCRNDCAWLFALCAAIDTPLDADTSASLRCLLRKCATLRAEKASLDDEVIMLNILVTISGKYFGQSETG